MNRKEIADFIDRYLTEDGWRYSYDAERGRFRFGLTSDGKIKNLSYHIVVGNHSYTVLAISPIGAEADDKEQMNAMAEYLCRANFRLKNGNFEFDFRSGEIRYKSFVDAEDSPLSQEVLLNSLSVPSAMFKRFGGGIIDIIYGRRTPEEAIRDSESDLPQSSAPAVSDEDSVISAILEGLGDDDGE